MNRSEAASLTAALMTRKGEAQPSRLFALTPPVVPAPRPARPEQPVVPAKDRRRLTLRLDPERHMRLKLAAAHLDISLQDILIAALDAHLAREAPCPCLAADPK
jgi:hypothetical protein